MVSDDTRNKEIHTSDGRIIEPDRRQKPPPAEAAPGPQVLNADTVRSAPPGRPVLVVLVASLAAAVTLFAIVALLWALLS